MNSPTRIPWLRAPLMAVLILLFALLAFLPAAAVRAQTAPVGTSPTVNSEMSDMIVKGKPPEVHSRNTGSTVTEIVGDV